MPDVQKLLEERRTMFITGRRDVEIYIERFFKEVDKLSPNLLTGIEPIKGRTAQEIFPSLYTEPFNEEQYEKEYAAFDRYYQEIFKIGEFLNKKAEEVLKDANNC